MKPLLKILSGLFPRKGPTTNEVMRETLSRRLIDCKKRSKDYIVSDPYLAGVNAGRAEIIEALLDTIYKE